MIRSLYVRVVVTFSIVVVVSVFTAFQISLLLNMDRIAVDVEQGLLRTGERLAEISKVVSPGKLEEFLSSGVQLRDDYSVILFDESGNSVSFGADGEVKPVISEAAIHNVLQGGVYQSPNTRNVFANPPHVVVGVPLATGGKSYALFLMPKFSVESQVRMRYAIVWVLSIVIVNGSILIAIASRYIVRPIKQLTRATRRLAGGDFDVSIPVRRKDELGSLTESFNHMAKELKQLEQMRQDFVSNVSHEIQSPLTSIRGFSKALHQPELSEEERRRYLGTIERESERLSRLADNLLKLASLESEHHPFHPVTFNLDEQLRRVVLACEPQWMQKQLQLDMDLPKVKLTADADQLEQVWMNLLHNSIKFTPPQGVIQIGLTIYTDTVEVSVRDSGIGISQENMERIFERFYKEDKSRQRKIEGSGLGLAIVRRIVQLHGGFILVKSEASKGTEFKVSLPIQAYPSKR